MLICGVEWATQRERVLKSSSWSMVGKRTVAVYEEVLAKRFDGRS